MNVSVQELRNPTDKRIYAIATALYDSDNYSVKKLAELTQIDPWFLHKINNILKMVKTLKTIDYKVIFPSSNVLKILHNMFVEFSKRNYVGSKMFRIF